jgi:hypothetical protein
MKEECAHEWVFEPDMETLAPVVAKLGESSGA